MLRSGARWSACFARPLAVAASVAALLPAAGCHTLVLWWPEQTKTIPAEYRYLADRKVVIVVRAPEELLFDYPNVRWEVADHLRVALEANVKGVKITDPKKVDRFQREDAQWERMDPALVGKRFDAERVLEVDLTQYTTREPESPHLYRGHISAVVRVYNADYPNSQPTYREDVHTVYPPGGPGRYGTSDRSIRADTMQAFAQEVANRFYDRTVVVR